MAAATEQPKKAQTAFWLWLAENRAAITKELGTGKGSAVSKAAGEKWKAVSEADKAPFEAKATAQKAEYEKAMEEFKSQGGVAQKRRSAKDAEPAKKQKDPEAPKRPVGGAYGVFLADNREAIKKSLPADHKITDVAKVAGEQWKAISETDRAPFQARFTEKQAAFKLAMEEYKKLGGKDSEGEEAGAEGATESKEQKSPKGKRAAAADGAPAAKRGRSAKVVEAVGPQIDGTIMKEAEGLGFTDALKNLAGRQDVTKSGKSHQELLDALKTSNGLVNPAKRALLGA